MKLYCNECNKEMEEEELNDNEREEVEENMKNEGCPSFVCSDCINKEMEEFKERESIAEDKLTILNTPHYAVEVKETDEGVIIDVFQRHGDLIDSYTYWNDDVIGEENE